MRRFLIPLCLVILGLLPLKVYSQQDTTLFYEKVYDDPYLIKKLYFHFQPLYAEIFTTNVTLGSGVAVQYYHEKTFDLNLHYRRSWLRRLDLYRDASVKNNDATSPAKTFQFIELGGTYHVKDFEAETPTRIMLFRKNRTATTRKIDVPMRTEVVGKLRKIYGARLGGFYYTSTTDVNKVLTAQGGELVDQSSTPIPTDLSLFTSVTSAGLYVGGSMSWIRNFAVEFLDEFELGGEDYIWNAYLDILYAPSVTVDDLEYMGAVYPAAAIETSPIGFRLGFDGKNDRDFGWAYGAEVGMRPGIANRTFFLVFRVSVPVHATNFSKLLK